MTRLVGPEWKRARDRVLRRDQYICSYCLDSDKPMACDHIVPVSRGGSNDDSNLTAACQPCNSSKGALTLAEWCRRDRFTVPPWMQEFMN